MYINKLRWQIKTIKDALEKIASARGKAEKEAAISECLQNEVAAEGLRYLLDPGIVFHCGEKTFGKDVGFTDIIYDDFFEMLKELNSLPALPYMTIAKVYWPRCESPVFRGNARRGRTPVHTFSGVYGI